LGASVRGDAVDRVAAGVTYIDTDEVDAITALAPEEP
jgi:hypothetical protein